MMQEKKGAEVGAKKKVKRGGWGQDEVAEDDKKGKERGWEKWGTGGSSRTGKAQVCGKQPVHVATNR